MSHDAQAPRAPTDASPAANPGLMIATTASVGDLIAQRYRLDEHIDTDATGRQIWRGADLVLRRPVAVVLRQPGGEAAAGMITAAVAISRLVHPHLTSVYDAIDEGHHAYVVREWVLGLALRDVLRQSPFDAQRAILVTHAIAEAVSALHAVGIVHGNIHPGTILIADDGRVVLTDPPADAPAEAGSDVRAIGAVLYACLTAHWPGQLRQPPHSGQRALADAPRDSAGRPLPPAQVRSGIPQDLDEIATELLDPRTHLPPAAAVAAEFARMAGESSDESEPQHAGRHSYPNDGGTAEYGALEYAGPNDDGPNDRGPMGFAGEGPGARRWALARLALAVVMLTIIAIVGAVVGVRIFRSVVASEPVVGQPTDGSSTTTPPVNPAAPIPISPGQIRVVDPPGGDRQELVGSERAVDGNDTTGWSTDVYTHANFGGIKPGMGLLINLGRPTRVGAVRVLVSQQGASVGLRTGPSDPGNTSAGDANIATNFTQVGKPFENHSGTVMVFAVPEPQRTMQYLLVWITKLPLNSDGRYTLAVNEITVLSP